jgi:5-formyltetrahydrofolate cyclo-ligase
LVINLETKKEIRVRLKKERALLSPELRQTYSKQIVEQVISHPLYRHASEIYCYVSFGEEVSTGGLISYSLKMGKRVAVPKIIVDNSVKTENSAKENRIQKMEFYYIDNMNELEVGYFGIKEPPQKRAAQGENVLVIMPGVGFDVQGNRIGYGKGFYDVYLGNHPRYRRLALAFSMQCQTAIPAEEQDIRPEIIVTEKECLYVDRNTKGPGDLTECSQYKA